MKARPDASNAENIEARFRAQYREYQYHFVEFFTEHLSDCSREFGGDLQQMLVLALIGQMHLQAHPENLRGRAGSSSANKVDAGIALSRIADVSGIPRETVRRKLAKLAERGWVEQQATGGWQLAYADGAPVARGHLKELDDRSLRRIAGLHNKLQRLLE